MIKISEKIYTNEILEGPTGPSNNVSSDTTPNIIPNIGDIWVDTSANPPTIKSWNGVIWQTLDIRENIFYKNNPPLNPIVGSLWYDTNTNPSILKYWNGTSWIIVQNSYGPTGPQGLGNGIGPTGPQGLGNGIGPTGPTGPATLSGVVLISSAPPSSPTNGTMYFDTTLNKLRFWKGYWSSISPD